MAEPTELLRTGLIGAGIGASKSPWLHEGEAAALGLRLAYARMDLNEEPDGAAALPRLVERAEAEGYLGFNVTFPVKQAVMPLLHDLSDAARTLGAVNTVVLRHGRRFGDNTDWFGFAEGFRRGLPGAPVDRVAQMGAGGAGSAIAYAMLQLGVGRLEVFDTDAARAGELVERLDGLYPGRLAVGRDLPASMAAADGLINTTPLGMADYPGMAVPAEALRPDLWVAEVVYFPLETELLRCARAAGCRTVDGGGMMVFQAAQAFELMTGVAPDAERMLQRFRASAPG